MPQPDRTTMSSATSAGENGSWWLCRYSSRRCCCRKVCNWFSVFPIFFRNEGLVSSVSSLYVAPADWLCHYGPSQVKSAAAQELLNRMHRSRTQLASIRFLRAHQPVFFFPFHFHTRLSYQNASAITLSQVSAHKQRRKKRFKVTFVQLSACQPVNRQEGNVVTDAWSVVCYFKCLRNSFPHFGNRSNS